VDDALREGGGEPAAQPARHAPWPYSPITLRQRPGDAGARGDHGPASWARSMGGPATRLPPKENPLYDPEVPARASPRVLACAKPGHHGHPRYGAFATEHLLDAAAHDRLEAELERHHLAAAP